MTTYPTSTGPAAKAWLYGQMVATLTPASDGTFQLSYAIDTDNTNSPDDMVWLVGVQNRTVKNFAMVGNLGQYALAEEYDITIGFSCYRAGESNDADATQDPAYLAEQRVWALIGQVETIVRTDPTFGGLLWTSQPMVLPEVPVDWDDSGNGRIATAELSIHCQAVL